MALDEVSVQRCIKALGELTATADICSARLKACKDRLKAADEAAKSGGLTCKTCVYWDEIGEVRDSDEWVGWCRRFPPNAVGPPGSGSKGTLLTVTLREDWCGEHPNFPAYVAALKSAPAQPAE